MTDETRVPPHDIQAEQSVLGGMMLDADAAVTVMGMLTADHFYRPAHQIIYAAICALTNRGEPCDAIAVNAELTKRGEATRAGGALYLHTLTETIPTAANTGYYAKIVSDQALLRRLVEVGTRAAQLGYTGQGDPVDLVDAVQAQMLAITETQTKEDDPLPADYMPRALDRIQQRATRGGGLQGLPTGFADFDALTNGLLAKQMVVIGARPSVGKTTLALDWARQAAIRAGAPVAFFSLEMGEEEITDRLLSAEARVPLHTIKSGLVDDAQWHRMSQVLPSITDSQLVIKTGISQLAQIRAACRRMKRSLGLRMVVIDYLQLVTTDGRYDNKNAEVTEISRALKLLAVELDVTVVALSQLNRKSEERADKKPQMSDLRESGAIEQDADLVVLLHREDVHDKDSPRAGEADLLLVKHRNGPTAEVTVAFKGHYAQFADLPPG
ncbi:replicative DNA helicase [Nocardiopsis algeriensis]|uniref:Replicative DNA helicase n=1 Tax=Nocardiopsis algeriensis TaxID=1478215 RepID=A0A841IVC4_9ACTN|nr:replicative DNA helicase [Nocardiopsis algeriensis]MBB6122210.1 replicative DNA helicase [Nocardiopsis algeriensis]